MGFLNELFSFLPKDFQCPDEKNVFLFHGRGDTPTEPAVIQQWVKGMLPQAMKTNASVTKEFDLTKHNDRI